jgi:hypothetical protein
MNLSQPKWRTLLLIVLASATLLAASRKRSSKTANLLTNGRFEKWDEETGEPEGWHTRITSVIPIPEYRDPENKKGRTGVVNFKCGCGTMWGTVRPWTNLVCSNCGQMNHGLEDSASLYDLNFESVEAVDGKSGKGAGIKMTAPVGNNQGVRIISKLIKAKRGAGYKISFDAKSKGAHLRVFVEGFQLQPKDKKAAEWVKTLDAESNPLKFTHRLKRRFRKHINVNFPSDWKHFSATFAAQKRYAFDYMFVTLYAYLPGEASYDNVVLRKLTASELKEHYQRRGRPKDKRLR